MVLYDHSMNNLLYLMQQKRKEYFELAKTTNLEKICYKNLLVLSNDLEEEITAYCFNESNADTDI